MSALLVALLVANADDAALSLGGGRCGALRGGVALPCRGDNFEAGSSATCQLGRHHLHPLVVDTITDAYALLREKHPSRRWQYGEMGWLKGGSLKPHQTHQNGRAADFFFPVVDERGEPDALSIHPANLLGYGIHFKADGTLGGQRFDAAAVADHLHALDEAGKKRGVRVERVILDAPFQRLVGSAEFRARFNKRPVWIAHDQHYHVDFDIPAALKRPLRCGR